MRVTFASQPARPGRANEDFIAAAPQAAVLLDGAGTPAGVDSGCSHGVAWYSHTLGSTLLATVTQSAGPLPELLADSIKTVASLHDATCDLNHPGSPSAAVVMLRQTAEKLEWLVLADSVLILDARAAEPIVVCDERAGQIGARYRAVMDALPGGTPEHTQALREYIQAMREHRNRDGGFWVASIDPLAAEQALTGTVPADQVVAAAVLSDGASRLVDRFELATWRETLDMLAQDGPEELISRVRAAERSDLDGSRWPRGKTFDDATAAFCRI